jgi:hypothetical protein
MGAVLSRKNVYSDAKIAIWKDEFEALKLSEKEVRKIYKIFNKVS